LDKSNINFTNRLLRIMRSAEEEAKFSKSKVLNPEHLLIACLQEKTGVLGEISLKCNFDLTSIRTLVENLTYSDQGVKNCVFSNVTVTEEVVQVMEAAIGYMKRYNQVYLNEGHVLKALITTDVVNRFVTEENKNIILTLGATSRDMITHLSNYTFPDIHISNIIRKVNNNDFNKLANFVEHHFSYEWLQTIRDAFLLNEPSIYIALGNEGNIVGFAAFDVYKNKKCYFGPMGISLSNRINGVGYSLLHHCLKDMKEIGYEYAVIGGAGPIEFYEKACNAVVIPTK
jgi:N-acetylglutamate synthase-like GNAT family acetyltransferase